MAPRISRRTILASGMAAVLPGAAWRVALPALGADGYPVHGYGELLRDPARLLDLPPGFSYRVISRAGEVMADDLRVPGLPDGMHAFAGPAGTTLLVRNHELNVGDRQHAFAGVGEIPAGVRALMYDEAVGVGGTTTLVIAPDGETVRRQYLSLAGTLRNCSGGATPRGTWVSCEESVVTARAGGALRNHGYAFEVSPTAGKLEAAKPLTAMGRFHREAIAEDPHTGIVYQTEDQEDGLLYRFVPATPGRLDAGGRLQALALSGFEGRDTGNRGEPRVPARVPVSVRWVPLDEPESPADNLRQRGLAAGASSFVRGEGMAVEPSADGTRIWFKCSAGGPDGLGQIWCYRPSPGEGREAGRARPGTLELFLEPGTPALMNQGDNLALAPSGDLLVCEDSERDQRIQGVTRDGGVYPVARNVRGDSEFAGATFSPDAHILYVNLQRPGLTFAIRGPWRRRQAAASVILHVDMDAFYASIEEREDPSLVGRPVIVGGTPEGRGVVAAANYEARRYGVHSAMPAGQARRLCPQAVFVRSRMELYAGVSRRIRAIFARYTPLVEPLSLDEAFLDVTHSERLFGDAVHIARRIKEEIRGELRLVASVGVAENKFLAKLASALEKPDGLTVVPQDGVQAFLDPLPVTRVWGVGEAARATLEGLGVRTVRDLRSASADVLRSRLGRHADHLVELAHGIDRRVVVPDSRARSISHETTFSRDVDDADTLRARLFALAEQVARRARDGGITGRRVQVKLRYGDFRTVTRARTLGAPTAETDAIWRTADALMGAQLRREPGALRLIGVGLGAIPGSDEVQADLFAGESSHSRGGMLDRVSDDIARRFGDKVVHRAGALRR